MKRFLLSVMLVSVTLVVGGCSFRDGIQAVVKPEKSDFIAKEFVAWLQSNGFRIQDDSISPLRYHAIWFHKSGAKTDLLAGFSAEDGSPGLFIGKFNSRSFNPEEQAIVEKCAVWMVSLSESFDAVSASRASCTESIREALYAKIRKAA